MRIRYHMPMPNESISTPEHPPRNLKTSFRETLDAIASIENRTVIDNRPVKPTWLDRQGEDEIDREHNNVANARRWLAAKEESGSTRGHFDIFGEGGINRWRVHPDGRVTFYVDENAKASILKHVPLAQALGFDIEGAPYIEA